MIFIERVQQFGQVMSPALVEQMRRTQEIALQADRERRETIREAEQAREARIKATEAARAAYRPEATIPFEKEASRRVAAYQARNKLQDDRKRFMKEVRVLPSQYSRPIVELIKAYDSYESLPGYSAFSRGASVRDILPAIMQAHEELRKAQAEARRGKAEAWEQKHDIIEQQIDIERQAKAERQQREQARRRTVTPGQQAARDREEQRRIKQEQWEATKQAEFAAHPVLPGSPPVSAAISQVAAQYGITPGQMDAAVFQTFRRYVAVRAKQIRNQFYYYKPPRTIKHYYNVKPANVDAILKAEGYTAAPAYGVPTVVTAQEPTRAAAPSHTTSPDDPIIQEAIRAVIAENQLRSGQQIPDIAAFQRLVAAKTRQFSQTKTARPADITQAVDQRVRFILNGARAM